MSFKINAIHLKNNNQKEEDMTKYDSTFKCNFWAMLWAELRIYLQNRPLVPLSEKNGWGFPVLCHQRNSFIRSAEILCCSVHWSVQENSVLPELARFRAKNQKYFLKKGDFC